MERILGELGALIAIVAIVVIPAWIWVKTHPQK